MDPKFQTSFIPKKPAQVPGSSLVRPAPHRGTSVFMVVAVILFIASLAGVGGAYLWKTYLISNQAKYRTLLAERQKQFNTDLIEQLKQANTQIDLARQVLANHLALSGIFDYIQRLTIEKVRFNSLDIVTGQADGIHITMSGYGANLASVAFQSDVLASLEQYGLRKIVKNPMLTNPGLDPTGTVSFGFSAVIDPSGLNFEKLITGDTGANAGNSNPGQNANSGANATTTTP